MGKGKPSPEINKKHGSVVKIHTGLGVIVLNQIKNSDFENYNKGISKITIIIIKTYIMILRVTKWIPGTPYVN